MTDSLQPSSLSTWLHSAFISNLYLSCRNYIMGFTNMVKPKIHKTTQFSERYVSFQVRVLLPLTSYTYLWFTIYLSLSFFLSVIAGDFLLFDGCSLDIFWAILALKRAGHVAPVFSPDSVLLLGKQLTDLEESGCMWGRRGEDSE